VKFLYRVHFSKLCILPLTLCDVAWVPLWLSTAYCDWLFCDLEILTSLTYLLCQQKQQNFAVECLERTFNATVQYALMYTSPLWLVYTRWAKNGLFLSFPNHCLSTSRFRMTCSCHTSITCTSLCTNSLKGKVAAKHSVWGRCNRWCIVTKFQILTNWKSC